MSESGAKSSQPLASKGEKDVAEKRGRGRPRKKPQVRGVPWEEGMGGSTPLGSSVLGGRVPPGYGAARNPPTCTLVASPWQGWGCPGCSPHYLPSGSTSRVQQIPLGGSFRAPPSPATPQSSSSPREGQEPPLAPPQAAAEPAFADGLIKAPLGKAAQKDKMLPEP